jgi:hypothetical protein
MKLLGITGTRGSGKGTVAQYVAEWAAEHGLLAIDRGFADKLKWAMARIFWPEISMQDAIEWANEFKNDPRATVEVFPVGSGTRTDQRATLSITGRQLFQHGGTEMARELFGTDFWTDQLLPLTRAVNQWEDSFWSDPRRGEPADIATISDLRFENEAQRITNLGGTIWKVDRPGFQPDGHASEIPINGHYIDRLIINDGTLDVLREAVFRRCDRDFL